MPLKHRIASPYDKAPALVKPIAEHLGRWLLGVLPAAKGLMTQEEAPAEARRIWRTEQAGLELREAISTEDDGAFLALERRNASYIAEHGNRVHQSVGEMRMARIRKDGIVRAGIYKDNELIGITGAIQRGGDRAEVSIVMAQNAGGHGYGTSSIKALTAILEPDFKCIYAEIPPENHRSIAVVTRAGYAPRGVVSGRGWSKTGRALVYESQRLSTK